MEPLLSQWLFAEAPAVPGDIHASWNGPAKKNSGESADSPPSLRRFSGNFQRETRSERKREAGLANRTNADLVTDVVRMWWLFFADDAGGREDGQKPGLEQKKPSASCKTPIVGGREPRIHQSQTIDGWQVGIQQNPRPSGVFQLASGEIGRPSSCHGKASRHHDIAPDR
ncbi:unnamed protein product [Heligmosomoides polygyrus]|uniref:Uncharacterized protein n=1 Tax=Heligmosomoides polygyrus TaxID=6339 RepID=A0A3P8AP36_HELPZ|nr:unnamed protein product [Heligmosomoides polygyrus]